MGIFFPDNDKRQTRLIELSTDTQEFLFEATTDYTDFRKLNAQVNKQIAEAYDKAGLKPPSTTKVDILKAAGIADSVSTDDTIVEVVDILVDIAGFAITIKYLAPAATRLLVRTGAMTAETAAKVLVKFTVPVVGREVEITAGDIAGNILSGIFGGVAIAGIDLGIDAIEGAIVKDKLRKGLHTIYPMRTATKLSFDKAKTLLDSIRSVKTTLDALTDKDGKPIVPPDAWDQLLKNVIAKDVQPAVDAEKAITVSTVTVELNNLDHSRNSWTVEDIH